MTIATLADVLHAHGPPAQRPPRADNLAPRRGRAREGGRRRRHGRRVRGAPVGAILGEGSSIELLERWPQDEDGRWRSIPTCKILGGSRKQSSMGPELNYVCPHCRSKLRQRMSVAEAKGREQAFCPYCFEPLPARSGEHTLGYELIEPPPKPAA